MDNDPFITYPNQPLSSLLRKINELGSLVDPTPSIQDTLINTGVIDFTTSIYAPLIKSAVPKEVWDFMTTTPFECLYGQNEKGNCNSPPFLPKPEAESKEEDEAEPEAEAESKEEDETLKNLQNELSEAIISSHNATQKAERFKEEAAASKERADKAEAGTKEADRLRAEAEAAKERAEKAKEEAEAARERAEKAKEEAEKARTEIISSTVPASAPTSAPAPAPELPSDLARKSDIEALRLKLEELRGLVGEKETPLLPSLPSLSLGTTLTDMMKKEPAKNRISIRGTDFTLHRRNYTIADYKQQFQKKVHNVLGFQFVWPYDTTHNKYDTLEDTQQIQIVFLEPVKGSKRSTIEKMKEFIIEDYKKYRNRTSITKNTDKKSRYPFKGSLYLNEDKTLNDDILSSYFMSLVERIPQVINEDDLESLKDFAIYVRLLSSEMYIAITEYLKTITDDFRHIYFVLPSSIYPDTAPEIEDIQSYTSSYFTERSRDTKKYSGIVKIQVDPQDLFEINDETMSKMTSIGESGSIETLGGVERPMSTFAYSYLVSDLGSQVGVNTLFSLPYNLFTMGDVLKIPYFVSRGSIERLDKRIENLEKNIQETIVKTEAGIYPTNSPFKEEIINISSKENDSKIIMNKRDELYELLIEKIFSNFRLYRALLSATEVEETLDELSKTLQKNLEVFNEQMIYTYNVYGTSDVTGGKKSQILNTFTNIFIGLLKQIQSIFQFGQLITIRGQRLRKNESIKTLNTAIHDIIDKFQTTIQRLSQPAPPGSNKEKQLQSYSRSTFDFVEITFTPYSTPTAAAAAAAE